MQAKLLLVHENREKLHLRSSKISKLGFKIVERLKNSIFELYFNPFSPHFEKLEES